MASVGIVSAFGRGRYLAERLAEQGLDVHFIDLSHLFLWPEKMWGGPFPLIQSSRISSEMWDWLEKNYSLQESLAGFSVFGASGAFEFRGSSAAHRVKFLQMDERILHTPAQGFDSDFERSWPLRLMTLGSRNIEIPPSRSLSSTMIRAGQESLVQKIFRLQAAPGKQKISNKIQVIEGSQVEDIAFQAKGVVDGVLIKKERSELLKLEHLVWTLSSGETAFVNPKLNEKLFGDEIREAVYSWVCYEVKMTGADYFPHFFIWMEDPELPWSHHNFLCFHRLAANRFQVWLKIPTAQRFLSTALAEEEQNWTRAFSARVPGLFIEVLERPLERQSSSKHLGPAMFGTFKEGVAQKNLELKGQKIYFLTNEKAQAIAPHFLFELEENIERQISKWWKTEQEQIARKKMRESQP